MVGMSVVTRVDETADSKAVPSAGSRVEDSVDQKDLQWVAN